MKNKFVILMGSDGAGKSTIAQSLNEKLGYEVHHFGPPKNHEDGFYQYTNFIINNDKDVICDRFHEGERIFAPLYRGYEAEYFPDLERTLMKKFDVTLVLIHAPFNVIEHRLQERGEDFVKPEHFDYCYDKVVEIFNDSELPKMIIDTSRFSINENVEKIINKIL